jgi:hypothetical protein
LTPENVFCHRLSEIKAIAETASYCVGMVAAIAALLTYRRNSRTERAKWAIQLHHSFYESEDYKKIRDKLDTTADAPGVLKLVKDESGAFTDYLNFFEMVMLLTDTKQLPKADVLRLFRYYLRRLKQHPEVMKYLNNKEKDFDQLSRFLNETEL